MQCNDLVNKVSVKQHTQITVPNHLLYLTPANSSLSHTQTAGMIHRFVLKHIETSKRKTKFYNSLKLSFFKKLIRMISARLKQL